MIVAHKVPTKVADEVWIAAALLQREHPGRADFAVGEIVGRARALGFKRPGVYVHAIQHCVANRPPNPGPYRMLFETAPGRRRLYRPGDPSDPGRAGSKTIPRAEEMPPEWRDLLGWYEQWRRRARAEPDPLLALVGTGREVWADEHADAYIERLRSDGE